MGRAGRTGNLSRALPFHVKLSSHLNGRGVSLRQQIAFLSGACAQFCERTPSLQRENGFVEKARNSHSACGFQQDTSMIWRYIPFWTLLSQIRLLPFCALVSCVLPVAGWDPSKITSPSLVKGSYATRTNGFWAVHLLS